MEVAMRLGKEQAAGYVEDTASEVAEQAAAPLTAEVMPVLAVNEPATAAR
jgi:hypothetical protein